MPERKRQGADLVVNVKKPDRWQGPSKEVRDRFHEISKHNPLVEKTVSDLTDEERENWIELLVQATFQTAGKDWRQYEDVYQASILKCKETRVLDAQVWSKWGGQRDVRAKLDEMCVLSKLDGYLYVLPAPSLVATVVVKHLRSIQTKDNDDEATIRLDNLHQFDYLGFAIENYKPRTKYIATDIEYKFDPNVKQRKLTKEQQAQKNAEEIDFQEKERKAQERAKQEHLEKVAKNRADFSRRSTPEYDSQTGEPAKTQSKPSSVDKNRSNNAQMPTDTQLTFPPTQPKTVEVTINRDEALEAAGGLINRISGLYNDGQEAMEGEEYKALTEQLQQILTEQMVIVLPKREKDQLNIWAIIEQHNEIGQWIRAAKRDKTEHSWMEEVANQEDRMAALEKTNKELVQSNKELVQRVEALKELVKKEINRRELLDSYVKGLILHHEGMEKSVKSVVAVTSTMKRKLDEAFPAKPNQSQIKGEED